MMMRHNSGFFADGGKGFEDVYTPCKCRSACTGGSHATVSAEWALQAIQ